jgi:hypothetical protein
MSTFKWFLSSVSSYVFLHTFTNTSVIVARVAYVVEWFVRARIRPLLTGTNSAMFQKFFRDGAQNETTILANTYFWNSIEIFVLLVIC